MTKRTFQRGRGDWGGREGGHDYFDVFEAPVE